MRVVIPATAIGLALAAIAATGAQAQTVITQGPLVTVPAATVVAQPTETVQTTETVRTIRPARAARRQIVTTRTITRRIVPAPTVVARTVTATPQPLYDEVATAPIADSPQPPLYDSVAAPAIAPGAGVASEPYIYRYVYEPDRILVIDPASGIAVQSIPR